MVVIAIINDWNDNEIAYAVVEDEVLSELLRHFRRCDILRQWLCCLGKDAGGCCLGGCGACFCSTLWSKCLGDCGGVMGLVQTPASSPGYRESEEENDESEFQDAGWCHSEDEVLVIFADSCESNGDISDEWQLIKHESGLPVYCDFSLVYLA